MRKLLSITSLPLFCANQDVLGASLQMSTGTATTSSGFKINNKTLQVGHDGWVFTIAIESAPTLCLDAGEDGTLQAWECNGQESQLWFFDDGTFQIQWAGDSSKCIDAGDMSQGHQLALWDCNGYDQQRWSYDGTVYLATDNPMCMDLYGGSTDSGTPIVVWDCLHVWSQTWTLSSGITIRASSNYALCLDLAGGSSDNGTPVQLWECNGMWEQKWIFDDYQIKFAGDTSKCIDAGGLAAGNKLFLWDCNGADQQFFGYDGSTIYMTSSSADASLCIDLPGGSVDWGTQLEVYDCNNCWNQMFDVIGPVDGMFQHGRSHNLQVGDDCPGGPSPAPPPGPPGPSPSGWGSGCDDTSGWANQYQGTNPLGVQPAPNREDNYFLIIGDWGKDGGPGSCQNRVADLMKQYVQNQAAQGKTLLFIASVGDNFYWSGQDGSKWSSQWGDVYGTADTNSPLYNIPWLAILGNHDMGTSDPYLACPGAAKFANVGGQDYGSRQFNKDKNPDRPDWTEKFWMPDYNFHYEIPEIGVEVVGVDTNGDHVDELNGHGHADAVFNKCGGKGAVQGFLGMVKKSGDEVLKCRASIGSASTVLVMQHYPDNKLDVKGTFEGALNGRQVGVISAYGHTHEQKCEGTDGNGQCNVIMTGSGGGCCDSDLPSNHAGFTAVHLTSDGGYTTDVESDDVRLPKGACTWNFENFRSWWNDTRANAYV